MTVLHTFTDRYQRHWADGMRTKLGLRECRDVPLIDDLLVMLTSQSVDYTSFFRALANSAFGDAGGVRSLFTEPAAFDGWADRWRVQPAFPTE